MKNKTLSIDCKYIPMLVILLGTMLGTTHNFIATSFGFEFPYNSFVYSSVDLFADYFKVLLSFPGSEPTNLSSSKLLWGYFYDNPYGGLKSLQNGGLTHFHHPPLNEIIFLLSRQLIVHIEPAYLYIFFIALWLAPLIYFIKDYLNDNYLFIVTLCAFLLSYPFIFSITRGNIGSGIVGATLIIAILLSIDRSHPLLAAVLIGIAINVKPNAIIFLGIFFFTYSIKSFLKYSILGLFTAALIFYIFLYPSTYIYPDYNIETFFASLQNYYKIYIIDDSGLAYGSSALGAIKLIYKIAHVQVSKWAGLFIVFFSITALIVSALLNKLKHLSDKAGLFILCVSYIISSGVFADYHLLVLFSFILLYTRNINYGKELNFIDMIILTSTIATLIPKNYFFYNNSEISYQVILNPLILIFSILLIIYHSLKSGFSFKRN